MAHLRLSRLWLGAFLASSLPAAELAGGLTARQIRGIAQATGMSAYHRAWTAAALPNEGLGLNLGLEGTFLLRRKISGYGNGNGVAPRVIPVPRLWANWDLPADLQVSASYSPGSLYDGVTTVGGAVQWAFLRLPKTRLTLSSLLGHTYADVFGDLRTHVTQVSGQVARDLGVWQPYLGLGFLVGNATAKHGRNAPGVKAGPYTVPRTLATLGANLDLGAKFAFQVDFVGTKVSGSLVIAEKF